MVVIDKENNWGLATWDSKKERKKRGGCYLTNIPVHFMIVGYINH